MCQLVVDMYGENKISTFDLIDGTKGIGFI